VRLFQSSTARKVKLQDRKIKIIQTSKCISSPIHPSKRLVKISRDTNDPNPSDNERNE